MKHCQIIDFGQCIRLIEETSVIGRKHHPFTIFQIDQNRVDEDTEADLPAYLGVSVLCETRRVVKTNPKGGKVIYLTERVVFRDSAIHPFFHCKRNSTL